MFSRTQFEEAMAEGLRCIDPAIADGYVRRTVTAIANLGTGAGFNADSIASALDSVGSDLMETHAEQVKAAVARAAAYGAGFRPDINVALSTTAEVLEKPWRHQEMTLSERIHGSQAAMREGIVRAVQLGMDQYREGESIRERLYQGYGYGGVLRTANLPKYLEKIVAMADDIAALGDPHGVGAKRLKGDIAALMKSVNALAQNGSPTGNLKAAYAGVLRAAGTLNAERLRAAVYVAVNERTRYYAQRIERTEIARAVHDGFIAKEGANADVVAWKWMLGSRHKRTDICDLYAKGNLFGFGPGVFPKNQFPPLPAHPMCMCHASEVYEGELANEKGEEIDAAELKSADWGDATAAGGRDYLKALPPDRQEDILGKTGARKFRDDPGGADWEGLVRGWKRPDNISAAERHSFSTDFAKAFAADMAIAAPSDYLFWHGIGTTGGTLGADRDQSAAKQNRKGLTPAERRQQKLDAAQAAAAEKAVRAAARQAQKEAALAKKAEARQATVAARMAAATARIEAKAAARAAREAARLAAEARKKQIAERSRIAAAVAKRAKANAGHVVIEPQNRLESVAAKLLDMDPAARAALMHNLKRTSTRDLVLEYINREIGFDGKPLIAGKATLDQLEESGALMSYRGITGSIGKRQQAEAWADELRQGYFRGGLGMYGNGTYSTIVGNETVAFSGRRLADAAFSLADAYAVTMGYRIRYAHRPGTKFIEYEEIAGTCGPLVAAAKAQLIAKGYSLRAVDDVMDWLTADEGRLAALCGFDAILVEYEGYAVTLNRTKIIIQVEEATKP